jgi:hypothetical protein
VVGEVVIANTSARFRDGTFLCDIAPGQIVLVDHVATENLSFPPQDKPVEIKAALREEDERMNARGKVIQVLEKMKAGLDKSDASLNLAKGNFLKQPSKNQWNELFSLAAIPLEDTSRALRFARDYNDQYHDKLNELSVQIDELTSTLDFEARRIAKLPGFPKNLPLGEARFGPEFMIDDIYGKSVPVALNQIDWDYGTIAKRKDDISRWTGYILKAQKTSAQALEPLIANLKPAD